MYHHQKRTRLEDDVFLKLTDSAPRSSVGRAATASHSRDPREEPETVTCRWLSGYLNRV
jgi:hypothetical protein